ncbi:atrial natriuretic peptide receptor 1-like isoform X2 [Paramacrobiotus metropolitanus]|nr:atrial natriuretic peptide receptor 1-like isoform X2 [Paramacrobiotus metropolitanus]
MLAANRLGMCEGEYAFVALDLYQNDIIGSGKNGWRQNDSYDAAAKHAYAALFVLTLMDKRPLPEYQKFERAVRRQAERDYGPRHSVDINYHTGAFHDSVIMFASTVNLTVAEGGKVDKEHIIPLTQRFWGIKWEGGASGKVYIDPFGDRSDDHSLYHMISEESGEFVVVANYFGYKKNYEEVANISWPNGRPPLNKPYCGYMGESPLCVVKGLPITEIVVGVALGILVLVGITGFLMYKRAREEVNLSSMDWLAQWSELTYNDGANRKSHNSVTTVNSSKTESTKKHDKMTLNFTTSNSFSKTHQVFFRGNLVLLRMCEKRKIELTKELRDEVKSVRIVIHENLMRFVGAILGPEQTAVLLEFCSKGNLQNLLTNDAFKLDDLFKTSLINDIIKGMIYIHTSPVHIHGRLNSRCCYIDSRFVLKIGDYGLPTFYDNPPPFSPDNEYFTALLWRAPEVINHTTGRTQEADVYSFGIIMQEIILREEPFAMYPLSAEESVRRVMKNMEPPFRPTIKSEAASVPLTALMEKCWAQNPSNRPRFQEIRSIMRQISRNDEQQGNIMDVLLRRMEQYAQNLESLVEEKTQAFLEEKRKSDQLLNQLLPKVVAEQLKKGQPVHPETYENVSIYFSDIVGFTTLSSESTPMEIVDFLNDLYTCFDGTIIQYDVYKVETIGDSYMCVSGLPVRNGLEHAAQIVKMALSLLGHVTTFKIRHRPNDQLKLRIGIHSGPCVAGVVGLTMPRYCLFGDTVNTASRMESTGEALKIQISSATKILLDTFGTFECEERGEIPVKGKGQIRTFWLLREQVQLTV